MPPIVSIAEYAAVHQVDPSTIRHQIAAGVIKRVAGGVDVEQAEAAWGRIRRHRITVRVQQQDAGARSAESKIIAAFAKLRVERESLSQLHAQYLDRAEFTQHAALEEQAFIAVLRELPKRQGQRLAELTGLKRAVADELLARLAEIAIAEFAAAAI